MKYRVLWIQTALDELTNLWTNADSAMRLQINAAVHLLDRQLAHDPLAVSESRGPGEWICFSDPLSALLEIEAANRIVWVLAVWRFR